MPVYKVTQNEIIRWTCKSCGGGFNKSISIMASQTINGKAFEFIERLSPITSVSVIKNEPYKTAEKCFKSFAEDLSNDIDFGVKWLGIPCSKTYFDEIKPVFDKLAHIRKQILMKYINGLNRMYFEMPNGTYSHRCVS